RQCHFALDRYPRVYTRNALGQTDRQGVLLQEAQVVFHVPRQGAQLLPELLHLLHHSFVEGLAVGPHGVAELLHLLVQVAAQLGQRPLQLRGVALQVAALLLRAGRDLGLQLLGVLLHLEGQALELVAELPLDVLRVGGQAAAAPPFWSILALSSSA
uniref:Uncharacterized protein n=1 Tax=Balaenoptera musculus TaxID=9771 RepID=A0A8C0HVW3_BALMU